MKPKWVKTDEYFKTPASVYFKATHKLKNKTDKGWCYLLYKGVLLYVTSKSVNVEKCTHSISSSNKQITRAAFYKKFKDSLKKAKLFGKYHS